MSGEDQEFPSRLRRAAGQPQRGLGSGYAQNQALVGAQDPEEAARLARMSPEEAQEEADRLERLQRDLSAMQEDLLIAIIGKQWTPDTSSWPSVPEGQKEWQVLLEKQPAGMITRWHEEMNKALDEAVDQQDEETLKEQMQGIGVMDPDDPMFDPLVDKARRAAIEKDLEPLDFEQMVWKGYCTQEITPRENFRITLRTLSTLHGLWLEFYMSQQPESSYQHTRHLFSLIQVACCLDQVNDKKLAGDMTKYTKHEQRDEFLKALEERMEFVGKLPSVLSDDLIIQYTWFTGRVRKLLSGDLMRKVGNS